mmetsp:Transcript_77560/g.199704  ORF Transcript_77560/g.199704 Transcript_77560/m.199704 type:complete len:565 (-) Transcript_77560:595-2289(-)
MMCSVASSTASMTKTSRKTFLEEMLKGAQWTPVLGSLFDAYLVCDTGGHVVASTPQADLLLGGADCSALEGQGLPDCGCSCIEAERLRCFLRQASGVSSAVTRIHASLRPLLDAAESFDATLSGIMVPAATPAALAEDGEPLLFVGVQLSQEQELQASSHPGGGGCLRLDTKALELHASGCPGGGDCLPPDAKVTVEGKTAPVALDKLEVGQRVLCYDHLSRATKFAAVREVDVKDATETQWVEVTLSDGATLQMATDHPICLADEDGVHSYVVRAGNLRPGVHSLERLKVVQVEVTDVQLLSNNVSGMPGAPPTERVSLSVHQPERHSIFVSSANTPDLRIAVGSSGVEVGSSWHWDQLPQSNTFITAPPESPVLRGKRHNTAPCALVPVIADTYSDIMDYARSVAESFAESYAESMASLFNSSASCMSGASSSADIVLSSWASKETLDPTAQLSAQASVSDFKAQMQNGLRSVGSAFHAFGVCSPCLMQQWSIGGRSEPCKFGALCGRCHETHTEGEFKKLQKALRRRIRGPPHVMQVRRGAAAHASLTTAVLSPPAARRRC